MKNIEIEFKYKAEVTIEEFHTICKDRGNFKYFDGSGTDRFYANGVEDQFFRHRFGPGINQLTFKKKQNKDIFNRIETNLELRSDTTEETVQALLETQGYSPQNSLYKISHNYKYSWGVATYYICYNDNMNELGRFIEIELEENNSVHSSTFQLAQIEKTFKSLGLFPNKRLNRSLFEMFGVKYK